MVSHSYLPSRRAQAFDVSIPVRKSPTRRNSYEKQSHQQRPHHRYLTSTPQHPFLSSTNTSTHTHHGMSRYSTLPEEDWQEGGMAIPLVPVSTAAAYFPPPSTTSTANPAFTNPRARTRRSGVMSTGADFGSARKRWSRRSVAFELDGATLSGADAPAAAERPLYETRKRKRWNNSIGSATTTVVGAVRESIASMGAETVPERRPASCIERDQEPAARTGKRRRFGRVLRGLAASFRGLGVMH
ncbi:MAG: hypothetical protein LQ345_004234 [Seirophora villosa]|nr:MAG: hypothetical protein LQ345_004234 [Seirophora villosa]